MNSYMRYPHYDLWENGRPAYDKRYHWLSKEHMLAYANSDFDREKLKHTQTGRKLMTAASLLRYDTPDAPELVKYWENFGLKSESHCTKNERWLSFVPKSAGQDKNERLPVILCFHICSGRMGVVMEMFYHELLMIAAQGDAIVLAYSSESEEGNELFTEILKEAKAKWPVDGSRVYTIGHSHYGRFALKYACRHPEIAGVMQSGSYIMLCPLRGETYPEVIEHDVPVIHATGLTEHNCPFPICGDAAGTGHIPQWLIDRGEFPWDKEHRILAWKRRQRYMNLPVSTDSEIEIAMKNDRASAVMGLKADRTEIIYADGFEYYIADFINNNGDQHFRAVGVENQPHILFPYTIDLSWSYIRRFARDQKTFKVIER